MNRPLYRIMWEFDVARFFKKFGDRKLAERILAAVDELRFDPRPYHCKRLQGAWHDCLMVRVSDYRIIYRVRDRELVVVVVEVGDRREVY